MRVQTILRDRHHPAGQSGLRGVRSAQDPLHPEGVKLLVLRKPGATASYKVYVVLDTDNEKGSDAVAVTRPV